MNWNLLFVQNWIPIILFELYLNAWHFPTNFTTVLVSKSSKFCICSRNYGFFVNKECPLPTLYGELLGKADSAGNISEPVVYKSILLTFMLPVSTCMLTQSLIPILTRALIFGTLVIHIYTNFSKCENVKVAPKCIIVGVKGGINLF